MKKILTILLALLFIPILFLSGCKSNPKTRVAHANLYAKKYIDYAEKVYFDVDKYPDMEEMGLFWTKWDAETQKIVQVAADSEQGAALVDPNKPTIINVHGVLLDGHYRQEKFNLNSKVDIPEEFELESDYVPLNYLWIKQGWNVANFHYNRFASENLAVTNIEHKIWSNEGGAGVRYRHQDGTFSDKISEYCLAEHFAAEYIRAMNLLPKEMGSKEIRVAAHSMGGELTTATIFLLTELAAVGQLPNTQLPDRFALLDSYFSTSIDIAGETLYTGPKDINIRWSGKPLPYNNISLTMIECLKDMTANGIAIEYYTHEYTNFLHAGMLQILPELKKVSSFAVVDPDWQGSGFNPTSDGHNAVREWYLCSLLADPIKDITDGQDTTKLAPSASLPTDQLAALKNMEFTQVRGASTVTVTDDKMSFRYAISYELNGGNNSFRNPKYYTPYSTNITLTNIQKNDATFDGWYLSSDFLGQKITEIDPSMKKDITLYAKWI